MSEMEDLAFVVRHGAISIYSPTRRSLDKYGPLQAKGYVTIRDVGSDQMQETVLRVESTDAGRAALAEPKEAGK